MERHLNSSGAEKKAHLSDDPSAIPSVELMHLKAEFHRLMLVNRNLELEKNMLSKAMLVYTQELRNIPTMTFAKDTSLLHSNEVGY